MNAYADLTTLKSAPFLDDDGTDNDTYFRQLLEEASEEIDKECRRHFFCKEETRYFDGKDDFLYLGDFLSLSSVKLDTAKNGTFETTMETTDYQILPLNGYPKTALRIAPAGDYSAFAKGVKKGIEIVGVWGFGNGDSATPYEASGATVDGAHNDTVTTIAVSDGTLFSVGQTIRVESEQMYIRSISANSLTVRRARNGTTAGTYTGSEAISIYEYPSPIREATLIHAMRRWSRVQDKYQDVVSYQQMGGKFVSSKGLDPDVRQIISQFINPRLP